jgi:hypothetical protein
LAAEHLYSNLLFRWAAGMTHNVCSNNAAVFGAQNEAHGAALKRFILWRRSAHTKPHQKPLSDHKLILSFSFN